MVHEWYKMNSFDFDRGKLEKGIVILSVGSCEQHSRHLPVGTDGWIGYRLCFDASTLCVIDAYLLPPQVFGYSPHHRAFMGYVTLSQETMFRYYLEVCECVFEQGVKKMLIVNSHGGNQSCLQTVVNELGAKYGYNCLLVRYWDLIVDEVEKTRRSGNGGMGHAGEFETSVMEYLYPDLVKAEGIADYPPAEGNEYHGPDMFAKNKVYQYKPFDEYSKDGNVGQPQFASSEEGKTLYEAAVGELAKLIDFYAANDF